MIHLGDFGNFNFITHGLDRGVDHVIGDPPYLSRSQDSQRRGAGNGRVVSSRPVGFSALTPAHRALWASNIAMIVRRWVVVFSDAEGADAWARDLETVGLIYIRTMVWIRGDLGPIDGGVGVRGRKGAPQFTGDRPATGHECMVLAHAAGGGRSRWNGGGKAGVYVHNVVESADRIHDAQKPLDLMRQLVRDFTDPGESILDPWAGSGTTVVAAKLEGRKGVGIELDNHTAKMAARRVDGTKAPEPLRFRGGPTP